MTSFEFVFGMISVITSLALTRLLSGCVGVYRHAERVRLSWRHGCWTTMAFMLLMGNRAADAPRVAGHIHSHCHGRDGGGVHVDATGRISGLIAFYF